MICIIITFPGIEPDEEGIYHVDDMDLTKEQYETMFCDESDRPSNRNVYKFGKWPGKEIGYKIQAGELEK